MKTVLYLIPFLMAAVIFLIRAEILRKQTQIYIFKPVSTLIVIAAALFSLFEPVQNLTYITGILIGLVLSFGGDLALMFPENRKAFTAGLGLFLMAHISYTAVFMILGSLTGWDVFSAFLLFGAGLGFYVLIKPNLGPMRIPVIMYIIVISVMVNRAVSVLFSPDFNNFHALLIISGAVLFYISDIILAAGRFWKPWKYSRISLVFYYSGQLLLALSAGYFG